MKLSQWAKANYVTYHTAYRMFCDGVIPNSRRLPTGTIVIDSEKSSNNSEDKVVVYARVSSSEQAKTTLESQSQRVAQFCNANGWVVHSVVKECASGLNDTRPKLMKILKDPTITKIVVEHKDRLTRFGFNYLKELFHGDIVVINEANNSSDDLMQDFVSVITSFCSRIYGQRRAKRKTESIIKELEDKNATVI